MTLYTIKIGWGAPRWQTIGFKKGDTISLDGRSTPLLLAALTKAKVSTEGPDLLIDLKIGSTYRLRLKNFESVAAATGYDLSIGYKGGTKPISLKSRLLAMVDPTGTVKEDLLYGSDWNDRIPCLAGNDFVYAKAGNDKIWGGAGNDEISGGDGNDSVWGGAGADTLYGDFGNDYLTGEAGNDFISGDNGNDYLNGGSGNDTLTGDAGNDTLVGGLGNDKLIAWGGNDVLIDSAYAVGTGFDRDVFWIGRSVYDSDTDAGNVIIKGFLGINDTLSLPQEWQYHVVASDVAGVGAVFTVTMPDGVHTITVEGSMPAILVNVQYRT